MLSPPHFLDVPTPIGTHPLGRARCFICSVGSRQLHNPVEPRLKRRNTTLVGLNARFAREMHRWSELVLPLKLNAKGGRGAAAGVSVVVAVMGNVLPLGNGESGSALAGCVC